MSIMNQLVFVDFWKDLSIMLLSVAGFAACLSIIVLVVLFIAKRLRVSRAILISFLLLGGITAYCMHHLYQSVFTKIASIELQQNCVWTLKNIYGMKLHTLQKSDMREVRFLKKQVASGDVQAWVEIKTKHPSTESANFTFESMKNTENYLKRSVYPNLQKMLKLCSSTSSSKKLSTKKYVELSRLNRCYKQCNIMNTTCSYECKKSNDKHGNSTACLKKCACANETCRESCKLRGRIDFRCR